MLSVLQYAVDVLEVKHVIVCGHYGCGAVRAAMTNESYGLVDKWLRNVKDVYRLHAGELDTWYPDHEKRLNRLIELNVREQVLNLSRTSIVQKAWQREALLHLHGWVYSLKDGKITDLGITITQKGDAPEIIQNPLT
eukprot:TRINITY_DN5308_c0_g1_i1.p1 TRINITY_DN5308_c0_g1~~TRINITY_DN5308_c0_g1_i1.p1  ORF type:complete len:137 (+),score=0.83 TRINITY_DN5308_c0_g1_i1:31-441(+)